MGHFIKLCVAVILLSFAVVPIYYGVSKEHKKIITSDTSNNTAISSNNTDSGPTLEEIYALAREEEAPLTAEALNNIMPAAGGNNEGASPSGEFSNGFRQTAHPNL